MPNKYRLVKLKQGTGKRRIPLIGVPSIDAKPTFHTEENQSIDSRDHGDVWILKKSRSVERHGLILGMCVSACLLAGLVIAWMVTGEKSSFGNLSRYVSSDGHGMFQRTVFTKMAGTVAPSAAHVINLSYESESKRDAG